MERHRFITARVGLAKCDDDALFAYLVSDGGYASRCAAMLHIRRCGACSAALESIDISLDDLLTDQELRELFARQLRQSSRNREGLQRIISACETALQGFTDRALLLGQLAIDIAENLTPIDPGILALQVTTWTRYASCLKAVGSHLNALQAIATAKAKAGQLPSSDLELALIAFTESHVLREIGQAPEALVAIRSAISTFARHDDARRVAVSREMEATVLYRMGDNEAALTIFEELLAGTEATNDEAHARLALSAGHCAVLLGAHDKARRLFDIAFTMFSRLERYAHLLRVRWGQARLALLTGDVEDGIEQLTAVWREFATRDMKPEWIRSGIELVEQLLKAGEPSKVLSICEQLYSEALDAAMTESALDALEFLRLAARENELNPDVAQHVRKHFDAIAANPRTPFQAPN